MVIRAFKKCGISVAIDGSEDEEMNINNIEDYEVESSDEDPFESCNQEESDHTPATESETSTSDESEIEGDSEVSNSEDIDIIDLCSDESGNGSTINRNVMPEDFTTMRETFSKMPGSFELPEAEDIIQDPTMSVTS